MSKNVALLVLNRGATSSPEGSKPDQDAKSEEGNIKSRGKTMKSPLFQRQINIFILLKRGEK